MDDDDSEENGAGSESAVNFWSLEGQFGKRRLAVFIRESHPEDTAATATASQPLPWIITDNSPPFLDITSGCPSDNATAFNLWRRAVLIDSLKLWLPTRCLIPGLDDFHWSFTFSLRPLPPGFRRGTHGGSAAPNTIANMAGNFTSDVA